MNIYNFEANIAGETYYFSIDASSKQKALNLARDFCFAKAEEGYSFVDFLKSLSGDIVFFLTERELYQKWEEVQSEIIELYLVGFSI